MTGPREFEAPPRTVVERRTRRLTLRRPAVSDLDLIHELHSDERTHQYAPGLRHTSGEQSREMLASWLAHWEEFGFGYWIAVERGSSRSVGCVGVKFAEVAGTKGLDDRPVLNLYYRLLHHFQGAGLGREGARETVAFAAEWLPGWACTALIPPANQPSIRTAEAAGLIGNGTARRLDDLEQGDASLLFEAPRFAQVTDPGERRAALVALWQRVNAAGGAVGFMGPSTEAEVRDRLDPHLAAVARGEALLGTISRPDDGTLLGFGFWRLSDQPQKAHVAWLERLMVEPQANGHNLGRILLAGLHALGRHNGIEIARLNYRGGTSLGEFYARCGYTEVGRVPGALRFGTDHRDDVEVATRLDGRPLSRVGFPG
ncbi:RimJ/RimL family protein N-acetyltransferase [Microlunatus panaciterrae]|uniref:RimJ/RimL family protein N-acetyltransferase n=1 Tax=Microlunatus panaciterrae TaxID=400768 RepID=A0ABS2RIE5_9ACTN|nr:RimJ/RimL family protein N-acetyltransferase [Microlunatus panaciterrae]